MVKGVLKKIGEFVRKEAPPAGRAAFRAATDGVKESLKRFPKYYTEERKK
jgi:hypothetical protein